MTSMEYDRIDSALRRIAAAVERMENCKARSGSDLSEKRYRALHAEAGAALGQLDDLIARLEG